MGTLLIYILKSAVCLAIFYLFYKLLMSRETFHRFNRFSLLGLMIICSIIPFAKISMERPVETVQVEISMDESLMMPVITDTDPATPTGDTSTMEYIILFATAIYLLGIVFFAAKEIFQFRKVLNITRRGKEEDIKPYRYITYRPERKRERDIMSRNGTHIQPSFHRPYSGRYMHTSAMVQPCIMAYQIGTSERT